MSKRDLCVSAFCRKRRATRKVLEKSMSVGFFLLSSRSICRSLFTLVRTSGKFWRSGGLAIYTARSIHGTASKSCHVVLLLSK
jgi:hypothetical protein